MPEEDHLLLGKYRLGRLLGRGTFAKVYFATSISDDASFAVKVLEKPKLDTADLSKAVLREVSAMRRLSHPNILKLHEVMATKSRIYLVTDFVAGGDLLSRISGRRNHRLPELEARRYFHQLVSALHYCHLNGVAHRDVKPQNLLIDGNQILKVSDFGLSAISEKLNDERLNTACGTPAYTAPEIIRRKGYDGPRSDAWSCGVLLFVLLTGNLPFDDSNIAAMYRKIQRRDYTFPPFVSPAARRIISRLLDPNPETRLSIQELIDNPWLKRCLSLDSQLSVMGSECSVGSDWNSGGNAFSIISMSSGLDLSGLLYEEKGTRGRIERFLSSETTERIVRRLEEVGVKIGYVVERKRLDKVECLTKFSTGLVVLFVEVVEMAPWIVLVELSVEGVGGKGKNFNWEVLKGEIIDVVIDWYDNRE